MILSLQIKVFYDSLFIDINLDVFIHWFGGALARRNMTSSTSDSVSIPAADWQASDGDVSYQSNTKSTASAIISDLYATEGNTSVLDIFVRPSEVLVRKVESDQSFLGVRHIGLDNIKDNILKSFIDLRADVYHEEYEKGERENVIDEKVAKISTLEEKTLQLELKRQRLNREWRQITDAMEVERASLRKEVDDLVEYQREIHKKRLIRELVYEFAVPTQMMNFQKIEDFFLEHQREIERLERMKIGATPSQIEIINKMIADLEEEFNRKLDTIDFQVDEFGRKFYYNAKGERQLVNQFRVFMDERGDYTIDDNGQKVYIKEYARDECGRFFLDDEGNRIYKSTPFAPECRILNDVLIRVTERPEGASSSSGTARSRSQDEGRTVSSRSREQTESSRSPGQTESSRSRQQAVSPRIRERTASPCSQKDEQTITSRSQAESGMTSCRSPELSHSSVESRHVQMVSERHLIQSKSDYLNFLVTHYADPLIRALCNIVWTNPIDPIDHLQKYIDHDVRKKKERCTENEFFKALEVKRRGVSRVIFHTQVGELRKKHPHHQHHQHQATCFE